MKQPIILKLEGSILTEKSQKKAVPKTELIARLAKDISKLYKSNKYQIILIHGAGSYGHPLAKKYKLNQKIRTNLQKLGLSLTQKSLLDLNLLLVKSLIDNNVPAISISPHSFIKQKDGKIIELDSGLIADYLKDNYLPILYGDVVLDEDLGASIISGDIVSSFLAKSLKVKKVIFLTDVDGIFDSNPKTNSDAKLVPMVNEDNLQEVLGGITAHNSSDVTSEMKGKLLGIQKHLDNVEVVIANGLKQNAIFNVLSDEGLYTKIEFKTQYK